MGCIIKYSYQLLFSLFALTHGQTLNFTVIGGYVNKTKTAQLNCQLSTALADVVDIFWNAKHAFNCVGGGCNPQLPSNYSDFSATQNDVAGTTVVTILNATKERDEVKWTCKYGTTLSADVNLTITCPASNSSRLIEESGYITLELICTCPYTSLDLTFYLGADSYTEVIPSKTVDKTACSSTYEASVNYTLILPLQHLKSYNGTFNVFVNNGFYTARFSGSRLYNFTAATTPPPGQPCWCTHGWCIGLGVASGGKFLLAVIAVIAGIIIFRQRRKDVKKQKCFNITIAIIVLLVIILVILIVLAWYACTCLFDKTY